MSCLFILLEAYNPIEVKIHKELSNDGGKLLIWLTEGLSLRRHIDWTHSYCFRDQKKFLPTKKEDRKVFLEESMEKLHSEMLETKDRHGELVLVGLGKLSCECLTGSTELSEKAGTYWTNIRKIWHDIVPDGEKVWIANSCDAALFDPSLCVEITRVLAKAAEDACIQTEIKLDIPMFDFTPFL